LESILWNAVKFTHQVSPHPAHASKVNTQFKLTNAFWASGCHRHFGGP
jgi:hypothetical protein